MALGLVVAQDIVNTTLTMYMRGAALAQTTADKPLLKALRAKQKTFPGGKDNVSSPVQGVFMSDTAGFFAGYAEDDALNFAQAQNVLRCSYPWRELHAGLIISETELKKDGISISDHQVTHEHAETDLIRLTGLLQNRLADYAESWARSVNRMLWLDGSQDAKAVPGVTSLLLEGAPAGSTGGLSRTTYVWWRNRNIQNITPSEANQTLSKTLRSELRFLRKYGGKPNLALCGSDFITALESEVQAKGLYTEEGFGKETNTDLGMATIVMRGLGKFEYDPTLDDLGLSKHCFIMDDRRLRLRPMTDEDNKRRTPERPYNYFVFLQSMTWTGTLEVTQLNACARYNVA